ncbi:hypothetical protein [Parasphingopyxis sp.]|uniref:hypothetical protein n=1 Tax=Parasphingopyxis sp. TaxID=1920299 RepID=UPI00263A2FEB|nr:hypothetical protein [Parasphingopyxis sp.]
MRQFATFACFDWSGQAVARPRGIALAVTRAGAEAPALLASDSAAPDAGWSRPDALDWLLKQAANQADMLIGFDFSAGLPWADQGAYFPQSRTDPADAKALWRWIDEACEDESHLSASTLPVRAPLAAHVRHQAGRETITGDAFEPPLGRLRLTEKRCRAQKQGNAVSCYNLVGAAQVGKSSFTGMRVLHRLGGVIPVWPFDPVPDAGPMLVEIYTGIAARAAGLTGPTKVRGPADLDRALAALGSAPHAPLPRYDDHSTDAILGSAWLRHAAPDPALWRPPGLSEAVAQQEGWTFGVR